MTNSDQNDAEALRSYLIMHDGNAHGLSDERLAEVAEEARKWVGGRRWSWKVVARNIIKDGRAHAGL